MTDDGWVDYVGLGRERGALNLFLKELGTVSPNGFKDNAERLAFWINSYNAFTVADSLNKVYGKHQSVRRVGGFFDGQRHLVAGEQLTLDEIEKRGRDLHDPRIHFAIVCASASCPKLQRFAYTRQALDSQLAQAAREFLADRNYILQSHLRFVDCLQCSRTAARVEDSERRIAFCGKLWSSFRERDGTDCAPLLLH